MSIDQNSIDIITSLVVGEHADNNDNANNATTTSGIFITPSVVSGRPSDITDYVISASDEYGKFSFVEQAFDLSLLPRVDVVQTVDINESVTANGRHGKITTVDSLVINQGAFEEFVVYNQYVDTDSIILLQAEIDSTTLHLVANAADVSDGSFIVRLSNYYTLAYSGSELNVCYAIV